MTRLTFLFITAIGLGLMVEAEPRRAKWADVDGAQFDSSRVLPIGSPKWPGSGAFFDSFKDIAAEPLAEGVMLGDIVREMGDGHDAASYRRAISRLLEGKEGGIRMRGRVFALLVDQDVLGRKWTPDEGTRNDGFVYGKDLDLKRSGHPHWSKREGDTDLYQVASFIRADLVALKNAENDYARYPRRVGANYEEIGALKGRWFRGDQGKLGPFDSNQIRFRSDLPWPFGDFSCHLRILNFLSEEGFLRTEVYSDSRDFYWLAGTDLFIPVRDSRGAFQGMIVVRASSFDLRGVPDGKKNRVRGLRSGLGNLQREAEPAFAKRGGRAIVDRAIPDYRVTGVLR